MIYTSFFQDSKKRNNRSFQHAVSHSLLAHGLFIEYSLNFNEEMLAFGKNGKPFFSEYPDIHFNISHCDGGAVCMLDSKPVGIDIENIRKFNERTAKRVCSDNELEFINNSIDPCESFFILWTLKESAVKNIGTGITVPLSDFTFSVDKNENVHSNHPEFDFSLIRYDNFVISICKTL